MNRRQLGAASSPWVPLALPVPLPTEALHVATKPKRSNSRHWFAKSSDWLFSLFHCPNYQPRGSHRRQCRGDKAHANQRGIRRHQGHACHNAEDCLQSDYQHTVLPQMSHESSCAPDEKLSGCDRQRAPQLCSLLQVLDLLTTRRYRDRPSVGETHAYSVKPPSGKRTLCPNEAFGVTDHRLGN